jgi:UDP-N-acetylmuramate dehydrogenase
LRQILGSIIEEMEKVNLYQKLLEIARGRLEFDAPLGPYTGFGVGGPADLLFIPKDTEDLSNVLKTLSNHEPRTANHDITILGGGFNVLIRDGGIRGLVILTTEMRSKIKIEGDRIVSPAGARAIFLSNVAADNGIGGFEFLCGIPGTVGGAVMGNAGAYDANITGIGGLVESVEAVDFSGNIHTLSNEDMNFSYRSSRPPKNLILTSVTMRGHIADKDEIRKTMDEMTQQRLSKQPTGVRTCGSMFKNPEGTAAGKLIDESGWKGRKLNGAGMSEKHANFMVNYGGATAEDIESLGNAIHDDVLKKFGIDLEWEIKRLGKK